MEKIMFSIQHRLNPLHLYCRLMDRGMGKRFSLRFCWYYHLLVYAWLSRITVISIYLCRLTKHTKQRNWVFPFSSPRER